MSLPFPVTDHCDGRRFFNPPGGPREHGVADLPRWWWQRLGRQLPVWPKLLPAPQVPMLPDSVPTGKVAVTFIGHATFLLQLPGCTILTDPVFSSHAGPFGRLGPKRVRPAALQLEQLPAIDAVLLSHNHYDHLDLAALRRLAKERRPLIVTTLGNRIWLEARGVGRVVELDWWQACQPKPDLEITCTPARHFAARTPWDRNRTLWGGFALKTGSGMIYFAGDSGWGGHFSETGSRLGPFALSLIPIGAYEPRWFMAAIHMNPEEAVRGHLAVRSRRSIGMHFGTFKLTDEAIEAPLVALEEARRKHGVPAGDFDVMDFGETRLVALG